MSLEQNAADEQSIFLHLGQGGDLAECFTTDVTWTTTHMGRRCVARLRFVTTWVALHNNMQASSRHLLLRHTEEGPDSGPRLLRLEIDGFCTSGNRA
jgi:hypothetical protein